MPQGSIVGPLLSMIYMNDIHNTSTKFHAFLFANDTNLTSILCSFDVNIDNNCNMMELSANINKELRNIQMWLEINKLSLDVKKIKVVIFSCDQAALWMVQSAPLCICPSVRLSHLFHYVPIIVSSWNFQEWLPMTEVISMPKVKVT